MLRLSRVTVCCCTLGSAIALAQYPQPPPPPPPGPSMQTATMAVQITQARQRNAALMRTYSWYERMDILKNGTSLDLRIDSCTFLPSGERQCTVLNDQHAPLPGGFFRKNAAENKIKELETYMKGLKALLDQYTLPTGGAVLNFLTTAQTTGPGPEGYLITQGTNVVVPGDSLTIYTFAATRQTARISVNTLYQGAPVQVSATFKSLPSGLNYMNYMTVDIPGQQMQLLIQNYDYNQNL
jgi:hypothetical protein